MGEERIATAGVGLVGWLHLYAPFPELSGISEPQYSQYGTDKFGITLWARL